MNENKFTGKAEVYDRARPGYPNEAIRYVMQFTQKNAVVADIGCGTGKLAEAFIYADCTVYGVEPNAEMRKTADRKLRPIGVCGGADFIPVNGTAEQTTLPDAVADIIVVGQALHWFDIEKFKSECRRILKPDGKVFVLYNTFSGGLAAEYEQFLFERFPNFQGRSGGNSEEKIKQFFSADCTSKAFASQIAYDAQKFTERALSASYTPKYGDQSYDGFLQALQKFFIKNQQNGQIVFENITSVYTGRY